MPLILCGLPCLYSEFSLKSDNTLLGRASRVTLCLQDALGGGPRDAKGLGRSSPSKGWSRRLPTDSAVLSACPCSLTRLWHLVLLPLPARPWPVSLQRPRAAWHSFICGGGTGTLEGPSSETAVGLEMECGTDGPGDGGFPQPHERALGIYSSWNHLQAHGTLFPAFIASSAPSPSAPSSGKVFLSCRRLK